MTHSEIKDGVMFATLGGGGSTVGLLSCKSLDNCHYYSPTTQPELYSDPTLQTYIRLTPTFRYSNICTARFRFVSSISMCSGVCNPRVTFIGFNSETELRRVRVLVLLKDYKWAMEGFSVSTLITTS